MRISHYILVISFFLFFENSYSQVSLQGQVKDSLKSPVPFCAVGLFNPADSSLAKGSLCDESGNYVFENLAPGNYFIRISHPGFKALLFSPVHLDSSEKTKQLPLILKSENLVLEEVRVLGVKAPLEFTNGNIIMNVENSPLTAGNTSFDLLSRLPCVMVDNEKISIQGKAGVRLYMDDRLQPFSGLQLINFLKSLPASAIEKIEIIVHPSSRYDASGNAGIIHIRSKKVKITGSSGSANASLSQGYYANFNGGVSYNYKGKKASVYSSINGSGGPKYNLTHFDKTVMYAGDTTTFTQRGREIYDNRNAVINLGADLYLDKKTILGAKVQLMPGFASTQYASMTQLSDSGTQRSQKKVANDWWMNNYNLNAERQLDTVGGKISASVDYYGPYFDRYRGRHENSTAEGAYLPAAAQNFRSDNTLTTQIISGRIDLEKKLKRDIQLGAGIKGNHQSVLSDYLLAYTDPLSGAIETDSNYTNTFSYREKITAAYLNLEKKFKKTTLQLGLRAENTEVSARVIYDTVSYARHYANLFPNLSLSYQFSAKHSLSFSYDKRIDRPDYNNFNPYKSITNSSFSSMGNPYLLPAYTHNLNLNYVFNSSIYNNLSFSGTNNQVASYVSQNDSTGETSIRITNIKRQDFLHYSFFIRKTIFPWWILSFNTGIYYIHYAGNLNGLTYSGSAVPNYQWLNSVFILPHEFKLEATAFHWSPWLGTIGIFSSRGGLNIGLKKSFLRQSMTCSVSINDIFFTENWRSRSDVENQSWNYFGSNDTRRLVLSLSYTFGKTKVEQRKFAGNDEENKRLKK